MHQVTICRKIAFSSGYRYFKSDWSEDENRRRFGRMYSRHGYGHNFVLEAHLDGGIDPETGMVVNLKEVDRWLREVTDPLDHHFLNTDVPEFGQRVPTTENLALYCFEKLGLRCGQDGLRLRKVRLYEGDDLWVDCPAGGVDFV